MKRLLVGVITAALVAAGAVAASSGAVADQATAPVLSPTPYMGWNTYYGVGGIFDEQTIISVANALIDRGLARAGYRIVWLDFGWASGQRDAGANQVKTDNTVVFNLATQ